MKRLIPILIATLASTQGAWADEIWSLDRCMAYAALHANSVRCAALDLADAKADRSKAVADFFPSISGSVGGQLSWGRNIDPETNTYNNITNFSNYYGINASIELFDGGASVYRFKEACSRIEHFRNNISMQQDERAIECMTAYLDAVYYLKSTGIAADKLSHSRQTLALVKRQEELGMKGAPDVAQAEAATVNDEYNLLRQKNLHRQSMLKLRSVMNAESTLQFMPDTTPPSLPVKATEDVELIYTNACVVNPVAIDSRLSVKEAEIRYKATRATFYPTLSVDGGISTSYYKTLSGGNEAHGFADQFRNNRGEYLGASLSIPLFSNLSRQTSVRKASSEITRSRLQHEETLRKLHDDIESAVMDLYGYAKEVTALEKKTEADYLAYRLNMRKYEEGLMSLTDMQLSADAYFESRISLLQKQLQLIIKQRLVDYYNGKKLWTSR